VNTSGEQPRRKTGERHPGIDWLEQNLLTLPNNQWVAARGMDALSHRR
jgi:hypothetical protein